MFKISPFLSVFYPESCKSCQDILVKGESFVCLHCELNFGEVMHTEYAFSEVDQLFWGKARIESAVAVFQFLKQEKLQSIIHEFKYKGNAGLAVRMGEIIGHNSDLLSQDIDAVSFVPMHPEKEKKRGYNQAQKLAEGFSTVTGITLIPLLKRVEAAETQTDKDVFERFENMENTFAEVNLSKEIKHVVLIDDVITTGATLAACASQLTEKGIKVSLVCLAYRGLNF